MTTSFQTSVSDEKKVLELRTKYGANRILPGITGLAQIHGRDELNGTDKASYDISYAKNVSAYLDIKILVKTFFDVICSRGVHDGDDSSSGDD